MEQAVVFKARREALRRAGLKQVAIFHNGESISRNLTSSTYPFRASSCFLHFFGRFPAGAIGVISPELDFVALDAPSADEIIWLGGGPDREKLITDSGIERLVSRDHLPELLKQFALSDLTALPLLNAAVNVQLEKLLGRSLDIYSSDSELCAAVIELRLVQDDFALSEIRRAVRVTTEAFSQGKGEAVAGSTGFRVLAAMLSRGCQAGFTESFSPIVATAGEVLHNLEIAGQLSDGELLLVDFGLETEFGYASDVTRTWAVGTPSTEALEISQIVRDANLAAVSKLKPGALYREAHDAAARTIVDGMTQLGVFRGSRDELEAVAAHTLVFPHGVGHLLGLDVHDMEEFGDLAGYGDSQVRALEFGDNALRLNRRLRTGMVVTIEPGIYFIPSLIARRLEEPQLRSLVNLDRLKRFQSLRGVRIEDDVLLGENGPEVLTAGIPQQL